MKKLNLPADISEIENIKTGDRVLLSGTIYTARDAAHKRLLKAINEGGALPFDLNNQAIYYTGPCPAKPGKVIGSAGPTTSARMDFATRALLERGVKILIGKGERGEEVISAIKENKAVYFAAVGGAGALISQCIKKCELIAYEDLLSEAIYKIEVCDMPLIAAIDSKGNNIYETERKKYEKK